MANLTGTDQADTIWGTATDDIVTLLGGDDVFFGQRGNDTVNAVSGNDV